MHLCVCLKVALHLFTSYLSSAACILEWTAYTFKRTCVTMGLHVLAFDAFASTLVRTLKRILSTCREMRYWVENEPCSGAYPGFDEGGCSCACANYRWVWLIVLHSHTLRETDCKYFSKIYSWIISYSGLVSGYNHVYTMNNTCIYSCRRSRSCRK